jgi:hypothetical protein
MSIKTRLAGGGCYLIKDWKVGHFYRENFPYEVQNENVVGNMLFIYDLLFNGEMPEIISSLQEKHSQFVDYYRKHQETKGTLLAEEKSYLKTIFIHDITYFLDLCKKAEG